MNIILPIVTQVRKYTKVLAADKRNVDIEVKGMIPALLKGDRRLSVQPFPPMTWSKHHFPSTIKSSF